MALDEPTDTGPQDVELIVPEISEVPDGRPALEGEVTTTVEILFDIASTDGARDAG